MKPWRLPQLGLIAAASYLLLPVALFLFTSVSGWIALPLGLLLGVALAMASRAATAAPRPESADSRCPLWPRLLLAAALASGVVALMGFATGQYCWDWIKHWALLNALVERPWPVQLTLDGEPAYLRFYVGAYLIPAGLASLTGWSVVVWTALWYALGLTLAFGTLVRELAGLGRFRMLIALLALLASAGLDRAMLLLMRPDLPLTSFWMHSEWWANGMLDAPTQFTGVLTLLLWVPHQAIAALLALAVLFRLRRAEMLPLAGLVVSALALWTPYGLIGCLPLLMARMVALPGWWRALRSPAVLAAAAAGSGVVLLMAWILSHEPQSGGVCFSCASARLAKPSGILLFLFVELALPLVVLRTRLLSEPGCAVALALLCALPWFAGPVPDAVMRVSMPALLFLFWRSAETLAKQSSLKLALAMLLLASTTGLTALGELGFQLQQGASHKALPRRDRLADPSYVVWAERTDYSVNDFLERCGPQWKPQYFTRTPPPAWVDR